MLWDYGVNRENQIRESDISNRNYYSLTKEAYTQTHTSDLSRVCACTHTPLITSTIFFSYPPLKPDMPSWATAQSFKLKGFHAVLLQLLPLQSCPIHLHSLVQYSRLIITTHGCPPHELYSVVLRRYTTLTDCMTHTAVMLQTQKAWRSGEVESEKREKGG